MVPCGPVLIIEKRGRGDLKNVKMQENVLDWGYVFYEIITYVKTNWIVEGN